MGSAVGVPHCSGTVSAKGAAGVNWVCTETTASAMAACAARSGDRPRRTTNSAATKANTTIAARHHTLGGSLARPVAVVSRGAGMGFKVACCG